MMAGRVFYNTVATSSVHKLYFRQKELDAVQSLKEVRFLTEKNKT